MTKKAEEKKTVSHEFGIARAIAVANGHPNPDDYAAKVEAEFNEPTPAAEPPADTVTATDATGLDTLTTE